MLSGLIPSYDADLFRDIHANVSTFLSPEENEDSVRFILRVVAVVTVGHLILLQVVKALTRSTSDGGRSAEEKKAARAADLKKSYQLTNMLVNLVLGCMGIYYTMHISLDAPTLDKIIGYEHFKVFSLAQIGYQLWALVIGIFFVNETSTMLVHHVAVICVCATSAFVHCGFRYYTPYFYGLIEISSVPLAIMNSFKDNKHWIKAYPEIYTAVRMVFAIMFLLVRVVLWTPFYWSFFAIASMLLYSGGSTTSRVVLSCFILASLVLTFLQYFWASKIVAALVKGPGPNSKES